MKLAINAVSAKLGGAVTYLGNLLGALQPRVAARGGRIVLWHVRGAAGRPEWPAEVEVRYDSGASEAHVPGRAPGRRLWFDQVALPRALAAERFDALYSSAMYGTLRCPCRQVLHITNTLPFELAFIAGLPARMRAMLHAQRWLSLRSIAAADVVTFPSASLRDLVATHVRGAPGDWRVTPYGVRHDRFFPAPDAAAAGEAAGAARPLRLLNVSTYNTQKNFGVLFDALARLQARAPGTFRLRVTAGFGDDARAGSPIYPRFAAERAQFRALAAAGLAEDTALLPHDALPALYREADVFVFPSITESFGFPLVEAMATGLPVVASDIPINRELCGDAALYAPVDDADAFAEQVARLAGDDALRRSLGARGLARAAAFRWDAHAEALFAALRGG